MKWDEFLNYEIIQIGGFKLLTGNLIVAAIVLMATVFFLTLLKRMIMKPRFIMDRIDAKRRMSIYLLSKYFVWVLSIVIVLESLGVNMSVLLVGSTALLVGLGLGVQNIFKDLVSGLFLLFEGTMKVGDIIEADNEIGRVVDINLRSSEILTREGVKIIIPNSRFIVEKIVNWSHDDERVRFTVDIGVAYGSDVEAVIVYLQEVLDENPKVLKDPGSFVRFSKFGDSSLDFELVFWSKETFVINTLKSDLRRAVYKKLNEKGLNIPFPQRDVHIKGLENMEMFQAQKKKD
jgi:small-conductance mechanosensitive channel